MGQFDKYWEEKAQYDKNNKIVMVKPRIQDSPNFSIPILKQTIENIDNMTDGELYNFLSRSYKNILSTLFTKEKIGQYIEYFQNIRFLDIFCEVLNKVQYLEKDEIVKINTICYHYITLPSDKIDFMVSNRLLKLSRIINRYYLPRLLGLGLGEELASKLLIARFSDINLNICVKRVDFIIITQPKELMTQNMIHEILCCLYDVMKDYYMVFQYMMLDVIPEYDDDDEKTWWVTDDISEVNSVMNLAILDILDNLPTQSITNIILNYSEGKAMVNTKAAIRFSLRTLSEDYYRINNVVNFLTSNGTIVP